MSFTNISNKELPTLVKAFRQDSVEEMLEDLELVDNMLTVIRSQHLLNKKRGLRKQLDGLLAIRVGQKIQVGGSNNHLKI